MVKKAFSACFYTFLLTSLIFLSTFKFSDKPVIAQNGYPPPQITPLGNQGYMTENIFLPVVNRSIAPPYTESYYIWNTSDIYGLGCSLGTKFAQISGTQDIFVFLDYGVPNQDGNGDLGTTLFDQETITINEISSATFVYALGFYGCNTTDIIKIAIGTNGSGGTYTDIIAYDHGQAWSNLVIDVNSRIHDQTISFYGYENFETNVKAVGGNNIEPGYNPTYVAEHWLDGYNSVTSSDRQVVYIIGSADGCPVTETSNHSCNNGWTQEDIYNVNWGYTLSYPFPEIYRTDGVMADQWYQIGLYAYSHHGQSRMIFKGEITQHQDCLDNPGASTCNGADIDPATGFNQLYNKISGDYRIINQLTWSTDISSSQ